MKKLIVLIISAVILIVTIITYSFYYYKQLIKEANENNSTYESFYNIQVLGTDLASLINKIDDENTKNNVKKDDNGDYIENTTNSIIIEVKFLELDKTIVSTKIEKQGINQFIQNFATMKFKCTKIDYHQSTKKVKYMYFEQVEN